MISVLIENIKIMRPTSPKERQQQTKRPASGSAKGAANPKRPELSREVPVEEQFKDKVDDSEDEETKSDIEWEGARQYILYTRTW